MELPKDIKQILSAVFDVLVPPSQEVLAARRLTEDELSTLLTPTRHREPWIYTLFSYKNPKVRALLRTIKYRGEKTLLPALGAIASQEITALLEEKYLFEGWSDPLLVPIPSSTKRFRERGYNQTERITQAILPHLQTVIYAPNILARHDRHSQVKVPKAARGENIAGAFFIKEQEKIRERHIILIDDVVESGTTLKDARRALFEGGARDVIAVVMAH